MSDVATSGSVTPRLVIENLTVAFDEQPVLDDLSLEVAAGETVAVVGPSGSGKSTLLRAVAGLEQPRAGRILLDGRDLSGVPVHRRNVGLMFQDDALFPHLDVAANVAYGLHRSGDLDRDAVRSRVAELLDLVGLAGFGDRTVDRLSGGEAQRVALARALGPTPALLMLDEPLGSLDRVLRDQLVADLDQLLNTMGQTSLHVTHDQAEASALADRLAVLADGRVVAVGTPQQLWESPRTRFVARFLGRPNLWTLDRIDGRWHWVEAGRAVGGEGARPLSGVAGPVTAVVPAAAIREADHHLPSNEDLVSGTIVSSQFHQGRYRHQVATGDHSGAVFTLTDGQHRRIGDRITCTVDLDRIIVLDD